MKPFEGIILEPLSREESNPGFAPDFPHVALRAEAETAGKNVLPWHWHKTVQLFYVESGRIVILFDGGAIVFVASSW